MKRDLTNLILGAGAATLGHQIGKRLRNDSNKKKPRVHVPRSVRVTDPLHAVDVVNNVETLYAKKSKISKSKIKQRKFARKITKALEVDIPFHSWSQYSNSSATTGYDQLVSAIAANDSTQFFTGDFEQYIIHGGMNWTMRTGGALAPYPAGALFLMAGDATLGTGAPFQVPDDSIGLKTTHVRATIKLKNNTTVPTGYWVNVYTFVAAQDITDVNYKTPAAAITTCLALNANVFGTVGYGTRMSQSICGFSPLDSQGLGKYWKQESKTRLYLPSNGEMELDWPKLRKPHFKLRTDIQWAYKGKTQGMYITVDGFMGTVAITNNVLKVEIDKTYHYKPDRGVKVNELDAESTRLLV